MELISVIEDASIAHRILAHLGLPTREPPRGPPWRPQTELVFAEPGDAFECLAPPTPAG